MSTTPQTGVSPLNDQSPSAVKRRRPNWWLRIGVTIVGLIGAGSLLLPSMCRPRETANISKCASNLHQIGLGILLYTQENGGRYPNTLPMLARCEQLTSSVFVCPSSNDEAAEGDKPETIESNMLKPHHQSYIYLGKGLTTDTAVADTIVAYEPMENHGGVGTNLLFGDGHSEWQTAAQAKAMIAKVALR